MGKGGKELLGASPRSPGSTDLVHSDPRFRPFLDASFDAASFASRALAEAHTSPQAQTEQLHQGIQLLDSQLRQEVTSRQGELIRQASRLQDTEASLQRIALSVRSLQSVAARVRAEVAEPYRQILVKSVQLRNLQRTVDLLRHAIHRIKLVQKLRTQMAMENAGILEVAKAARLLSDIATLDAEVDLTGLDVVDTDADFVAQAASQVRAQAEAALQAGLSSLSQADVGSALQVLFNLGQLKEAIATRVDATVAGLERSLAAALDPRKLTAAGGASGKAVPGGATSAPGSAAKDLLWDRLGGVCDALHRSALEVWHLQRVLAKKRDPLSHVLLLDVVAPPEGGEVGLQGEGGEEGAGEGDLPLDVFWSRACQALGECFAAAFNTARGGFVREALIGGYPRLASALEEVCARVARDSAVKDAEPALMESQALAVLDIASDFQNAYLAASVARMSDAVNIAFPGE
ncbi:hypothetical protein N2152v2_008880 [Parachlorella kessleri]